MRILKLSFKSFIRDWRAGEMQLITIAIIIAVGSLTSVSFFTDRVRQVMEIQATELLAADLVLQSRQVIPENVRNSAEAAGLDTALITSLRSMVLAEDNIQMAEIKAVESTYPLRGELRITLDLFSQEQITTEIPARGTVWVDSRLFQLLGLEINDQISVGASNFTVSKIISYEPDRGGDMFTMAPRLMMNLSDLEDTNLILPASRVEYKLLLRGQQDALDEFRRKIDRSEGLRFRGIRNARPELRSALERAEQFLGLAVLVSIALAGLAVAMSSQQYVIRHFDNCAMMRCLGATQRTINSIYIYQLLILSILSSLAGCILGYIAQYLLSNMLSGLTSASLPGASMYPVFSGMAAGIVTVMGFALPQILRLRLVSPLRVLRRELNPVPLSGLSCYGAAILALALLTPWQSGSMRLTIISLLGLISTALLLAAGARILISLLNRYRTTLGFAFRFGLSNIVRRANLSMAQILGIGLGVMVMLLLTLVHTDLLESWRNRLPEGTPNYFLINIQDDDLPRLRSFLEHEESADARFFPMSRGRLAAINGETVIPENISDPDARRWSRREYNLTWSEQLPAGNTIRAGRWWDEASGQTLELSLDQEFASELGVKLNDTMTFLIAGRELTARITSLREVEWDSFNVNFFVVASPGALEGAPASYVTSFYLPPDSRNVIIDLVKTFPSITVYDVDALITQVRKIMDQVIRTIEFVFGFTILAGIVVLVAALQTTHTERSYESALLSTIGASRNQIRSGLIMEFLSIGLIAGVLAAISATLIEALLAKYVFNMSIIINIKIWFIAPLICTFIIVAVGMAGTRRVLFTPPIVTLRQNV
jgi:putative ABC transport system permease protein